MVKCSESERQQVIEENNLELSYTEKRIWDMWRRWRMSEKTLWPWNYMTKVVYADDVINLENMEQMVVSLEREQEEYERGLEESRANRDAARSAGGR